MKLDEEKQEAVFSPYYLFIIDEPKLILNHAIMEYLQNKRLTLGFSIIYTTDQKANLPENIRTVCMLFPLIFAECFLKSGLLPAPN